MTQTFYRRFCGLDDPKVRIPVRANVFSLLQISKLLLGPTQPPGQYVLAFFCRIKGAGPYPNNSLPSSAEAMMLSTKVPIVLCFELNEQQKVRAVCVCVCVFGTYTCGKQRAFGSSDCENAVGEG